MKRPHPSSPQAFFIAKNTMKTIEIELSDSASAVITEMTRRRKVRPEAIARLCVEHILSQHIDLVINDDDGDAWFTENGRDPNKACREWWKEVENPGSYARVLGLRRSCLVDFICDRLVNIPSHNEEHTQARVNEFYHILVQIVMDTWFSVAAKRSFPRYEVNRDQSHRLDWENKLAKWENKLTKREEEALHNEIRFCWQSISRSEERRAVKRK
jgi:hypothetical protein